MTKTIQKQMEIADKILDKLETFDPTCILAGGAPRDWYFGKLATDLDFFVYFRPDLQLIYINQILKGIGFGNFQVKGSSDIPENYKRNPHLLYVFEGEFCGEVVQIMFMDSPTFGCVVDLFPFGICQAWYKGQYCVDYFTKTPVHVTMEFEKSVNHKILYLINELYNDSDGYIEKIRSKFPEYLYIGKGE